MEPLIPEAVVAGLNRRFEAERPQEIIRWALEDSGLERVAVASAFQAEGVAIIHMTVQVRPDIPVLFLETGFHFRETLEFRDDLARRLRLNVVDLRGEHTPESQAEAFGPRLYERDPARCCELNKVAPINRALRELDAWFTGLRREQSPTRADAPILDQYELEPGKTLVKVNPLATWSRREVWGYLRAHDLPHHPLYDLGFASIGCAPCTRAVAPGEDERAGRWVGVDKVECGIHQAEPVGAPGRSAPGG
ncbi:MAG: phosphoadenylyl-sulfate reductase [Actinomycetota bacterium]|nr:phosphoadenylyl-sulfate reductase [Actinomycetota bacterium]